MPGVSLKPFDLLANVVRAKEIAVVLVRHGFAEIIEQIETPGAWWQRFVPSPREHRSTLRAHPSRRRGTRTDVREVLPAAQHAARSGAPAAGV
jgi:hypothetical protein